MLFEATLENGNLPKLKPAVRQLVRKLEVLPREFVQYGTAITLSLISALSPCQRPTACAAAPRSRSHPRRTGARTLPGFPDSTATCSLGLRRLALQSLYSLNTKDTDYFPVIVKSLKPIRCQTAQIRRASQDPCAGCNLWFSWTKGQ